MKNSVIGKTGVALLVTCGALLFLPGCDWFNKDKNKNLSSQEVVFVGTGTDVMATSGGIPSSDTSAVVLSMQGKSVMTADMFENDFKDFLEKNPQMRQLLAIMPDMREKYFEGVVAKEIVKRFVEENRLAKTPEYEADMRQWMETGRQMYDAQHFANQFPISVNASDVKRFYDENKDSMPELLISHGGVQTVAVQFDNEKRAQEFLDAVSEKNDNFEEYIEEKGLSDQRRDLRLVNDSSVGVDTILRQAILEVTKFPTIKLVKVGDQDFWVIHPTAKEEKKHRPFVEVAEGLKEMLTKEKQVERIQTEIDKLKGDYEVVVNDESLKTNDQEIRAAFVGMDDQEESDDQRDSNATQRVMQVA